jgi:putative alpha-1,2-mannosidase
MGFYPVCPGSNQDVIGAPYVDKVTVNLDKGKQVTITREGEGCYIQSMTIDGKTYTCNYLDHKQLMKGCDIHFVMGKSPNMKRGTSKQDLPYSFSNSK